MATELTFSELLSAMKSALERQTPIDRDDEAQMDKALSAVTKLCLRRASEGVSAPAVLAKIEPAAGQAVQRPYAGMSISEAGVKYLQMAKRASSATDIADAIIAGGYPSNSEKPATALTVALKRRADNYGDVVKVGHGMWILREDMSEKERKTLEHKERTRRGMEARAARGLKLGQPKRMTDELKAEMEQMIAGGLSTKEVAERFKLHQNTVRQAFPRKKIAEIRERAANIKADDSQPPSDDTRRPFRVVEGGG